MLFKPSNYDEWIGSAISKIISTIDSCQSTRHLDTARTMVDNFVMMILLNDDYAESDVIFISRQLYLYTATKELNLYASY